MSEDIDPFKILNLPEEDVSQAAIEKVCAQLHVFSGSAANPAAVLKHHHHCIHQNIPLQSLGVFGALLAHRAHRSGQSPAMPVPVMLVLAPY